MARHQIVVKFQSHVTHFTARRYASAVTYMLSLVTVRLSVYHKSEFYQIR